MSAAPRSPAQLLAELAEGAQLRAAWIPATTREADPPLYEQAGRLMSVTLEPTGREDLVCLVAGAPGSESSAAIEATLAPYRTAPFLLLLARSEEPAGPVRVSLELLRDQPQLRARDLGRDRGPILLSPLRRLLEAESLAGEWSGAAAGEADAAETERADTDLESLWTQAGQDRRSLDALAIRWAGEARQLREARVALERANAEIERLRSQERHELARLQLMLVEERAWVAAQARRIAGSTSWRLGHRLTRLGRRLTLRADRGTDLPAMIARRMDEADLG